MKRTPELVIAAVSCGVIGLTFAKLIGLVRLPDVAQSLGVAFLGFVWLMLPRIRRRDGQSLPVEPQVLLPVGDALPVRRGMRFSRFWEILLGRPADSPRIPCSRCQAMILPQTSRKTGGLCRPCHIAGMPPRRKPRAQHYIFAHKLVPYLFFQDSGGFVGTLAHQGNALLGPLWVEAARLARTGAPDTPADAIDFPYIPAHEVRNLAGDATLVVLVLPTPIAANEAHFVGLLLPSPFDSDEATAKVYTLEHSEDHHRKIGTMLCGWTAEGAHVNYASCPPPVLEAFVAAVEDAWVRQRVSGDASVN
jgi:hypothetical protein